jgi:thymidylate synthase
MHLRAATLDDLLAKVFRAILKSKVRLTATKGANSEISGVCLELSQARARLSRTEAKGTIFSCIGEFLWYAAKSENVEQMTYYLSRYKKSAEPDGTVWGAYGPRLFGGDRSQYQVVLEILREKATSRQAVIQLFDRNDILKPHADVPCTCTLQFLLRNGLLHLIVHMRSNDAYRGLPHDVFAFTMLQEILANQLGVKLGKYKHLVGSLHIYDDVRDRVDQYLNEGLQSTAAMPPMPPGDPWADIGRLIEIEALLRTEGIPSVEAAVEMAASLTPYWADFARLLSIFALTPPSDGQFERLRRVVELQKQMSNSYYRSYIRRRRKAVERQQAQPSLLDVPQVTEATTDAAR